jgi:hypothetical protein
MQEAIVVLEKAEAVLMKRIRAMRDGSPKWAASKRLNEIRAALKVLKHLERDVQELLLEQDEMIVEALMQNPPIAQA